MKTTFDTNRFMNLLKYEIFTESKGFARGAIGLTVGLAFYFKIGRASCRERV